MATVAPILRGLATNRKESSALLAVDVFAGAKLPQDVLPVPLIVSAETGFTHDAAQMPHDGDDLFHGGLTRTLTEARLKRALAIVIRMLILMGQGYKSGRGANVFRSSIFSSTNWGRQV